MTPFCIQQTQVVAFDATDVVMYAWSTKWYTVNYYYTSQLVEHSADGEYTQTDAYPVQYNEATGLVAHPTEDYFYVSWMPTTELHANETRH